MTLYGIWRDESGMPEAWKHALRDDDLRYAECGKFVDLGSFTFDSIACQAFELCPKCRDAMAERAA